MYQRYIKRFFDLLLSGGALLLVSPIMAVTACAIRAEDGGPALFRQERVGKNGALFEVVKFRSMPVTTKDLPSSQAHAVKITKVGRFIRRANIDELPQLWCIFRGNMSLVGPRPALPAQADLNALRAANGALSCQPGLTGLAQINSYDGMPESEKAAWDGQYAAKITLLGDLTIIFKTFGYLMRRPPVY